MVDFQQMVELFEDSVLICLDAEGAIRSWNAGAERIIGYRASEAIGKNISIICSEEARAAGQPQRDLETVLRDGEARFEAWRMRSDGTLFPARVRQALLRDANGEVTGIFCRIHDLTEVRQLEEESEARLRTLVEGVEDCAIFMLDTTGHVRSWNAGARRIKQYTAREILGRPSSIFYTPEDQHSGLPERLLLKAAREGFAQHEGWRVRRDGSRFRALVRITALRDKSGVLVGFSKVTRDLTEQRAGEEARQKSEKLLEGIVRISEDAIISIDRHQRITLFNQGAEQTFGYTAAEITGQKLDVLVPKRLAAIHRQHVENFRASSDVLRTMNERRAISAVRRDGSEFPAEASISQFEVGGERVMTVRLRDITERRLAEEALKRSEARFASIVQITEDAIIALDDSNAITLFNKGAETIFGYSWQEVLGQKVDILLPGRFAELLAGQSLRVRGSGVLSRAGEREAITGRRSDGTDFPAEVSIARFDVAGEHVLAIRLRDITERVRNEEEIKRSLEEKEVLLKEIHHRVKNNLQVVSSLLSLEAGNPRVAAAKELFLESQNRVASMALIHEKLYRSGDFSNIDFGDYIRSLIQILLDSYAMNPARIALTVDVDVKLDIHKAVPCGLIVNELLSNALKHAFPDGRSGSITLSLHEVNCRRILRFSDDGVGMAENFDFRRSPSLGLQLVTTLTSQIGGAIRRLPGPGTGFEIDFPVSSKPQALRKASAAEG
ncbi:MAG TPA: PAS domain S-box protein [Bryobacteraceae bacterium]|nr:PAS domain S-box protein [Bryobacteraceae bacterium]